MEAKEKAEELVCKYTELLGIFMDVNWESEAKQCALIAVDEILKTETLYESIKSAKYDGYEAQSSVEYWQQVKSEIKKL